jgi:hypothetical protein
MITKLILSILIIGFAAGLVDSAEGLIEFKKYKVINSPKVCGDKLCSEIDEQIAKKGESSHKIKVCGDRLCSDFSENPKPINKSSPFGQMKLGISLDLIQCKEGQEIVIKKTKQTPACVNYENVEKLREKNWAVSKQFQETMFAEIASKRSAEMTAAKTLDDFDVSITIIPEEINDKRYLSFDGNGWHRLHNVEITITGENFSESVRTKTDDRGHLNMPWPIPDDIPGGMYGIFATDGIHEFEISIPIFPSSTN